MAVVRCPNKCVGNPLGAFSLGVKNLSFYFRLPELCPPVRECVEASGVICFGNAMEVTPDTFVELLSRYLAATVDEF